MGTNSMWGQPPRLTTTPSGGVATVRNDGSSDLLSGASYTIASSHAGNIVYDGACTTGTNAITSATANFTPADVGKAMTVVTQDNVSGAMRTYAKSGTITGYNSATSVNVSWTVATKTGMLVVYGDDIGAELQAALTAVSASGGGTVFIPDGAYLTSSLITVPNNCCLKGSSNAPQALGTRTSRGYIGYFGTSLFYAGAYNASVSFLTLGANNTEKTAASLRDMNIDCMQLTRECVTASGWGSNTQSCTIIGGLRYPMQMGSSAVLSNSVIAGMGGNHAVSLSGFDTRIENNYIWGMANNKAGVNIYDVDDVIVVGNHIFRSDNITNSNAVQIYYDTSNLNGNIIIADNIFDDINGDDILVTLTGGSTQIRAINITGNNCFNSSNVTNNTYCFIKFSIASGCTVNGMSVMGNTKRGSIYNTTLSYPKGFANGSGIVGTLNSTFMGNCCMDIATAFYNTLTPTHSSGNIAVTSGGVATVV